MEVAVFVLCALHILSIQLQELPKILLQNGKAPVCGLPAEMEKKKDMKIQTEIAAVLLAAAVAALLLYRCHKRRQYPYRQKFLLTKTEYAFYKILEEKCTKNGLRICPKVRLEDFISVTGTKNIGKYRGYIKSRHVDFLICDKDLHIKAGLELDDHPMKPDRRHRLINLKMSCLKASDCRFSGLKPSVPSMSGRLIK